MAMQAVGNRDVLIPNTTYILGTLWKEKTGNVRHSWHIPKRCRIGRSVMILECLVDSRF